MGGRINFRPGCGTWAAVGLALAVALPANSASGQLAFSEVTAQSQIDFVHHDPDLGILDNSWWVGTGAAVADYDLDGDLDVYLVDSFGWPNQLYRNNGDKTFTNVTEESGLGDTGGGTMGLFVDLDNDGDPDLVVANNTDSIYGTLAPAQMFRNDGAGSFANVTDGSGFEPQGIQVGGMAATDYNQDGLLDLYVVYWHHNSDALYNYLYRNDGDLKFTDVTALVGLDAASTQVRTWTPVFVDLDGNGLQDLYAAVDFDANYMFLLDFDGVDYAFTDVSAEADIQHVDNDMGVAVGDCNGDGLLDLFSTNITFEPPNELERTNALYINQGFPEPFTEEAVDRGAWQSYWGWGAVFFDAELDGDLDIYSVGGRPVDYYIDSPSQLFVNDGSGYYEDLGAEAGADLVADSRGLVAFDYDADGDQDLLIVNALTPATLLENI
ncbi:MAG: VCBS repeat-containing protein, partial [Planctomycetes bacterium]|nr:VCBS repeat-containing protein [Planctomycetota bacterium]